MSAAAVGEAQIATAVTALRGEIDQVPSAVSAIKVDGQRAYKLVREGHAVELAPRRVRIGRFDVVEVRRDGGLVDVDVEVDCSSGTYIRALARDVGAALAVGGHLTALRRTRVGSFGLDQARTLDELAEEPSLSYSLDEACLTGVSAPRSERRRGGGHPTWQSPETRWDRRGVRGDRSGWPGHRVVEGRREPHQIGRRAASRHVVGLSREQTQSYPDTPDKWRLCVCSRGKRGTGAPS